MPQKVLVSLDYDVCAAPLFTVDVEPEWARQFFMDCEQIFFIPFVSDSNGENDTDDEEDEDEKIDVRGLLHTLFQSPSVVNCTNLTLDPNLVDFDCDMLCHDECTTLSFTFLDLDDIDKVVLLNEEGSVERFMAMF
jgi:hypothetical protein